MTTFNIQSQQAGSIQNVGRDMTVNGGFHSTAALDTPALRAELAELTAELAYSGLRPEQRYAALGHVGAAAQEAARPEPDADAVGSRVARAAKVLKDAGALAADGTALVGSLTRIAALLGPASHALHGLLAAV